MTIEKSAPGEEVFLTPLSYLLPINAAVGQN